MIKKDKTKYSEDYKTSDPNWWSSPPEALKGNYMNVKFMKLHPNAMIPEYKTAGASGMDLVSVETYTIAPGETCVVSTGLAMVLPKNHEGQVRPRSGLAAKNNVTVLNTPGTIDEDYRGEIKVIMINHGKQEFIVNAGDRIAQMVIQKVERFGIIEVDSLDQTDRGAGGLGSTGIK